MLSGLRWCDIKALTWEQINDESIPLILNQQKTFVEHFITLHPIVTEILRRRKERSDPYGIEKIFRLPTATGATKVLGLWCANGKKRITWNPARLSFSILLQDKRVDAATVALLLGHTTTKYVDAIYKRYRPKNQELIILKLPGSVKTNTSLVDRDTKILQEH